MGWTTPLDWALNQVVTKANLDEQVRDNMRYLKGMDGQVEIQDAMIAPYLYVNVASPSARMHVKDSTDTYTAIVENAKASGTPHGMLVAVANASSSSKILAVSQGAIGGSLTDQFVVRGDGVALSRGHDVFHSPQTGSGFAGGATTLTTSFQQLTGTAINVTELGYYWVSAFFYHNASPGGGDTGNIQYGAIFANNVEQGDRSFWVVPSAGYDTFWTSTSIVYQHTSGSVSFDARGFKNGGSGNSNMKGHLTVLWCAP